MSFILASTSPRRKELLVKLITDFKVVGSGIDESQVHIAAPDEFVQKLAQLKGEQVALQYPADDILACDTCVAFNRQIFGKPASKKIAFDMLSTLSGQTHLVDTGIWLKYRGVIQQKVVSTQVTFWPMSVVEIQAYLKSDEAMDKAGAYGIQDTAGKFVRKINGDYFNVMGLPVSTIYQMLK